MNPDLDYILTTPLSPTDLWGRQKLKLGLQPGPEVAKELASTCVTISKNKFVAKSLSCFSCNISIGCPHKCGFCSVSYTQRSGNKKDGTPGGALNRGIRAFKVDDPQGQWGDYVLVRPWDEAEFIRSLEKAENAQPGDRDSSGDLFLNPDGNRAVIFCSTCDPFGVIRNADPVKQKFLNAQRSFVVRRALELILHRSTLNVRILTRAMPGDEDWRLFQQFGNRLLFGVSLPTVSDELRRCYEPNAPGVQVRLRALEKAQALGVPRYVAVAPTFPESNESDLRATLSTVAKFNPLTVFSEPINVRGPNIDRMEDKSEEQGGTLSTQLFRDRRTWRLYAFQQLQLVQRLAGELGLSDRLHLWPDSELGSLPGFLAMRELISRSQAGQLQESRLAKAARIEADTQFFRSTVEPWLHRWWSRISEWPVKGVK